MHLLSGRSRLLDSDERLPVVREYAAVTLQHMEYQGGKAIKRRPYRFVMWATVQPAASKDLMLMPEGDRYRGVLVAWQPKNADGNVLQTNDKVLRRGTIYQVQGADDWGSYVKARLVALDTADRNDVGAFEGLDVPEVQDAPL